MNRALAILALVLAAPETAHADAIAGLGFSLGPEGVDVALRGSAPLRHPRIATSPGLVRLWFAGNEEYVHLNQRGDGRAVRKIRVRPGAEASHLVQIYLGDDRRLDPAAVRVEIAGNMAHVKIARADLPALPELPAAVTPAAEPAAEPAPELAPALPAATDPEPPAPSREPAPPPAAASPPTPTSPPSPAVRLSSPVTPRSTSTAARSRPRVAPLPAPRGPGVAVYALLTLGLAGAYLVLRLLRRGGGAGKGRPQIEVVAAKRLGPRHQLLVVRAFGRDHLLSVNGGTTQRIASVRSGEPNEGAAAPASKTMGGLFSKPWIDRSLGSEADADEGTPEPAPLPRPRRARPEEHDPAFGAELLQLTSATRARTSAPVRSDSVSGLLRLRQQAGK